MNAAMPPRCCASAMTCWQRVVLPDDSGPKISVIRPRGIPPTPSARSSAIEPVGIDVDLLPLGRAELHDRAARRTASRSRGWRRRPPDRARPAPSRRPPLRASMSLPVIVILSSLRAARPTRRSGTRSPSARCLSPRRTPARPSAACAGFRMTSTCCGGSDSGASCGWEDLSLGFFLASLWGRSRDPMFAPPRTADDNDTDFTPAYRRLRRHSSGRRGRAARPVSTGKVPARSAARILAMKSRVKVRL